MDRRHRPPAASPTDESPAQRLSASVGAFLHIEAAGGVVLLVATAMAMVWANSPWSAAYRSLWDTELSVALGGHVLTMDLHHWVNDGLMALFFFVVGLEIKHELVVGRLARARDAALPAVAAVGGMVVPAALYLLCTATGPGRVGWGIPMATDIAFATGVLALLGRGVPAALKVFLLALAIVDDIGAIVVIALFYGKGFSAAWFAAAVVGVVVVMALGRIGVRAVPLYAIVGVAVWFATLQSGVHATIAGVALGLLAPARPLLGPHAAAAVADELSDDSEVTVAEVRAASSRLRESVSVAERLRDILHPWAGFVVVPIFALANAGIPVSAAAVRDAAGSAVTAGIVAGLVAGKTAGITAAVWLARRVGLADLPPGVTMAHIAGVAMLAGIGFTVSLFITSLAFDDPAIRDQAKLGVLVASAVAALLGAAVLRTLGRRSHSPEPLDAVPAPA